MQGFSDAHRSVTQFLVGNLLVLEQHRHARGAFRQEQSIEESGQMQSVQVQNLARGKIYHRPQLHTERGHPCPPERAARTVVTEPLPG
jgi:hypothetical protein